MNEQQQPITNEQSTITPQVDWKRHFTTVTPLSKALAMLLFVVLPFVGFLVGTQVTKNESVLPQPVSEDIFKSDFVQMVEDAQPDDIYETEPSQLNNLKHPISREPYEWGRDVEIPLDWKEYTDDTYGFSFRYPPNLVPTKDIYNGGKGVMLRKESGGELEAEFRVSVDDFSSPMAPGESEMVTINGFLFEKFNSQLNVDDPLGLTLSRSPVLYTTDSFRTIVASAGVFFTGRRTPLSDFEKILQSFTYTGVSEAAAWNEYRNEKLAFEVRIPKLYSQISEDEDSVSFAIPREITGDRMSWTHSGYVRVSTTTPGTTLEDVAYKLEDELGYYAFVDDLVYTVDGHRALYAYSNDASGSNSLFVLNNGKLYEITGGLTQDEILTTFKFLP